MNRFRVGVRPAIAILLTASLAYLPLLASFSYSYDDWYLMYVAGAYGPNAFHSIFSVDRPLRAFLMIPVYTLFGGNPIWYGLSAYMFRCLGALALWWLLKMLWPKAGSAALVAALLFAIYPGFLSQPNAIDYQSHIVALFLAMLSLALTVRYWMSHNGLEKSLVFIAALLTGWMYLGLMEYYIGFELIRFLIILVLVVRSQRTLPALARRVLSVLPFVLIGVGFFVWRVYFFVSERKATNAAIQLGPFLSAPMQTAIHWSATLFQNFLDVVLYAWYVPMVQLLPRLGAWQIGLGLTAGILASVFVLSFYPLEREDERTWIREVLFLGISIVIVGLAPVVLANRTVSFPYYSRYTIVSATGGVLLCMLLVLSLKHRWERAGTLSVFIMIALFTHFANSVRYSQETASMDSFWWQVSWRVPQLAPNTTLVAHYPVVSPQEDYFIWGPANLIYYPESSHPEVIQPVIYAAVPNAETVQRVLERVRQVYDNRRTIITYKNYRNILILTQPELDSCVQVIDGSQPELSSKEHRNFIDMAPFSEIDHVLVSEAPRTPPETVFGSEPPHEWCYYFEKASLARQQQDWQMVVQLAAQVRAAGYSPSDDVEWLPFLQAYAMTADLNGLSWIEGELTDHFVRGQVCKLFGEMPAIRSSMRQKIQMMFCEP